MDGKPDNYQQLEASAPSDQWINMHKINLAQAELFQVSKQFEWLPRKHT
jgi:hypothetical protein